MVDDLESVPSSVVDTSEQTQQPTQQTQTPSRNAPRDGNLAADRNNSNSNGNITCPREARLIQYARAVVVTVLGISALVFATLTYLLLSHHEHADFVARFEARAAHVGTMAHKNAAHVFTSIETLAALFPLYAQQQSNTTLPFVTIPDWEAITKGIRNISKSSTISYAPLLTTPEQLREWNAYAPQHTDWISNGRRYLDSNDELLYLHTDNGSGNNETSSENDSDSESNVNNFTDYTSAAQFANNIIPFVFEWDFATQSPRPVTTASNDHPVVPLWQMSPVPPIVSMIHANMGTYHSSTIRQVISTQRAVLTQAVDAETFYVLPAEGAVSILLQPIFDSTLPLSIDGSNSSNRTVKGFLFTLLAWKYFFDNILPDRVPVHRHHHRHDHHHHSNGQDDSSSTLSTSHESLYVVVQTGNVNNTFIIQGSTTKYVGAGDLHDPAYSNMIVSSDFVGLDNKVLSPAAALPPLPEYDTDSGKVNATTTSWSYHSEETTTTASNNGCDLCDPLQGIQPLQAHARHRLHVYPTRDFHAWHTSAQPVTYAILALSIFGFCALVFAVYDTCVTNRQWRTERRAQKSSAIIAELFPGNTAVQLYEQQSFEQNDGNANVTSGLLSRRSSTSATNGESQHSQATSQSPQLQLRTGGDTIADFYPESTVLFADIAGFTAWSSTSDPHQVFTLLESIFQAFDAIAKEFGVFKVETIGDCYVAVCGVPKPNRQHAVVMSQFARCAMSKFRTVCQSLQLVLGPDTSHLALRVGMHSGPVTAGVIRGERARFQLFGDTVNTASRIESTGQRHRVQLSEQTAKLLVRQRKRDWIVKRNDLVEAKGKGQLVTYWLKLGDGETTTSSSSEGTSSETRSEEDESEDNSQLHHEPSVAIDLGIKAAVEAVPASEDTLTTMMDEKLQSLIEANCNLLLRHLRRVVAHRNTKMQPQQPLSLSPHECRSQSNLGEMARNMGGGGHSIVDEVVDAIDFPNDNIVLGGAGVANGAVRLDDAVVAQLRNFVETIASKYHDHPFHNFEHASHVTLSVSKLLDQLTTSSSATRPQPCEPASLLGDPLTQFALVLAALVHDLDHPGIPNSSLMLENAELAAKYGQRSIAEQKSVDLAWNCLVAAEYDELCATIYTTEPELRRFRHVLVNAVMATDIFDANLGSSRRMRWSAAFETAVSSLQAELIKVKNHDENDDRLLQSQRGTIILEHLMQAADVAHTMDAWGVYLYWNQRLFDEMQLAYRMGRSLKDPAVDWHDGELAFFDGYVIPLAQKLKECGAFGVASDECLDFALQNRIEWKSQGRRVVQRYVVEFEKRSLLDDNGNGNDPNEAVRSTRCVV